MMKGCMGTPEEMDTDEALLVTVIDRIRARQKGPFPSPQNRLALQHCESALACLQYRDGTALEGKHKK
jgi:hypothetical protein